MVSCVLKIMLRWL